VHALVVYNPTAGGGRAGRLAPEVVERLRGDVQVGPPGHGGQVGRPPPEPGQQPGRGQRVAGRQPQAAGGVIAATGRDHPEGGPDASTGVGQPGRACPHRAVAADGDHGVDLEGGLAGGQPGVLQGPGAVLGHLDPVAAEPLDHLGGQPPGPPATGRGVVHDQNVQHPPHPDHGTGALGGPWGERAPPTWIKGRGR